MTEPTALERPPGRHASTHALELCLGLTWSDVPTDVRARVANLLRDFVAVSLAGRATPTARLAADYATQQHPGDGATGLLDGRRLSVTGAAWANGVLANALDFDDGHGLIKGHPGAVVIPVALALGESVGAAPEDVLAAVAVGYELAIRAGLDLHARTAEYHGSGAWSAVGVAAAGAKLLGLDSEQTRHALGLAEYHAPMALIMRSVGDPAMTKDACGWGAYVGASSALLAAQGFTAAGSRFLEEPESLADLGRRWHVLDTYVKEFPCCRWSHPAIAAALGLHRALAPDPARIARVHVRTFAAATGLARRLPRTTEEAQYSLIWPVACALARGRFAVDDVLEPAFSDPVIRELAARVEIEIDPELDAAFPVRRLADVTVETSAGGLHRSGVTDPPGEPDDPRWRTIVEAKVERFACDCPEPLDALLRLSTAELSAHGETANDSPGGARA